MAPNEPPYSKLDLVERVDKWSYYARDHEAYKRHMQNYYYFLIDGFKVPFGYVPDPRVKQMPWLNFWAIDHEKRTETLKQGTDFDTRTELMRQTLRIGIESPKVDILSGWDDEMFALYAANGEHVLNLDGMGLDGFGVINFAVHMIGFVHLKEGTRYWIPRRAKTKTSYPNMLDNTVGEVSLLEKLP
ncbi:hypothetical protein BDV96DRAFT_681441 [Lophiotrema nucula]|uniref:Uncharacterized protein n=1 Tax=Lophiotrema nucula TaxID=690887 RepID=A0A6A5ZVA4_9PLEO|nr:hypothetical protein BDV96DRAFT_681441 [Lophiotrema nucula]